MSCSQGFVKIDTIVREALFDKGYSSLHHYPRYLGFALRMLRKLDIDHSENIVTKELPVSKKKTVAYPEDYIMKVGDRIWCFERDTSITSHTPSKYEANPAFYERANAISSFRFYNYYPYASGSETSSYFDYIDVRGYAYNGIGYFTTVDNCREFQLSSEIKTDTIILEYIASSYNPSTETFVPIIAQDVFREYIHWQSSRFSSNTSLSEVMANDREFWAELGNYKMRLSDLSYEGLQGAMRRGATLAIKG
jgi:hypothetical protein